MISVIVPCYNYGHLIADTIKSIQGQTYHDWELIIVNDGSKDNTEEVVLSFCKTDHRIRYIHQPNTGLAATRNNGMRNMRGEFVQFLDADDLIEPGKFSEQIRLFEANPIADVVYSSVRYFSNNPYDPADRLYTYWGENKPWMPGHTGKGHDILPKAIKAGFSHLSSPLFRRALVDKVGQFDNDFSAVADYDFFLRCCIKDGYFLFHDMPGTYSLVRWHPDNMSKNLKLMWSDELKMRKKLTPLLEPFPEAYTNNQYSMKSFEYKLNPSWKNTFLSGGKFDFIKRILRALGLEKLARKIFYK